MYSAVLVPNELTTLKDHIKVYTNDINVYQDKLFLEYYRRMIAQAAYLLGRDVDGPYTVNAIHTNSFSVFELYLDDFTLSNEIAKDVIVAKYKHENKPYNIDWLYAKSDTIEAQAKAIPTLECRIERLNPSLVSMIKSTSVRMMSEQKLADGGWMLTATDVLPNDFVVHQRFNTSFIKSEYDRSIGVRMLTKEMDIELEKKLFDLEAYRLYHTLNALSSMISQDWNDLTLRLISNGAIAYNLHNGKILLSVTSNKYRHMCDPAYPLGESRPVPVVIVDAQKYGTILALVAQHMPHLQQKLYLNI